MTMLEATTAGNTMVPAVALTGKFFSEGILRGDGFTNDMVTMSFVRGANESMASLGSMITIAVLSTSVP